MRPPLIFAVISLLALGGADGATAGREFFESRIRPVLAESCYECHSSSGERKAGLALDYRGGLLEGGDDGPVIVPGNPEQSVLLKALAHTPGFEKMPKAGPRVSDQVLADFTQWIADGAFDPRDDPPSADELAAETSWEVVRERRKQWWSFQPVKAVTPPAGDASPIDRFLNRAIAAAGVATSSAADKRALIRRASFVLTGLPPTIEEIDTFLADGSDQAYATLVDRLLASPRFGERWARHWMDWVRYAESHGSEGDPRIPYATQYRDYLIRALNADVPYDQLVREHLAGDLLEEPRVNDALGISESAIGPAHFRFVFHGFAPTDALDELVRFTDNQIDVVSKAFLGLTVSCARCHNHKFDAISQADFYALYGVFASCRPAVVEVDAPGKVASKVEPLAAAKAEVRKGLASAWGRSVDDVVARLRAPDEALNKAIEGAGDRMHPLHLLRELRGKEGDDFATRWSALRESMAAAPSGQDWRGWVQRGAGMSGRGSNAGELLLRPEGDQLVADVLPSGVYSGLDSTKLNGVLESPRMKLDGKYRLFALVAGDKAQSRYVVQNYPRNGTVYPVRGVGAEWAWHEFGLDYWEGDHIHYELSTSRDSAVLAKGDERSWFGMRRFALVEKSAKSPREEGGEVARALLAREAPGDARGLADLYGAALAEALERWRDDAATDADALLISGMLRAGLLKNDKASLSGVAALVDTWRGLEAQVPVPTRAPGIAEGEVFDQPLFVRGDHKQPAELVPRRFLEAFGGQNYRADQSGRRELADDILNNNPLAPRVIVNRLWHHVFGTGIVATADNFGQLGEKPSHPELLDYLAGEFVQGGYSIKAMLRQLVTTDAFQRAAGRVDGDTGNRMLAAYPVRRLEAEAIRDAMLAVSGRLDDSMFGGAQAGESNRRSVYVRVIRNNLDPLLRSFDAPEPLSTRGRRDVTNVPAQSLELMNSPFIDGIAGDLARGATGEPPVRVGQMFEKALGRPSTDEELANCINFIAGATRSEQQAQVERVRVEAALNAARASLAAIVEPARAKLLSEKRTGAPASADLEPIAAWEFDGDLRDSVGNLHGVAIGGAKTEAGMLVVDGSGFVRTGAIGRELRAKTLEAWVQLADLGQRGGGAISVQTPGGGVFDAIVFGERQGRRWMAGSDSFSRTEDFRGAPAEGETARPVHVAIVYGSDGTITGYRDGEPYGEPYRKGLKAFAANAEVLFGLRHGDGGASRLLKGRIDKARLYDRALTHEEIRASAGGSAFVTEAELNAALSEDQRTERERLVADVAEREQALAEIRESLRPGDPWKELAHSILNLKEFIYLR